MPLQRPEQFASSRLHRKPFAGALPGGVAFFCSEVVTKQLRKSDVAFIDEKGQPEVIGIGTMSDMVKNFVAVLLTETRAPFQERPGQVGT